MAPDEPPADLPTGPTGPAASASASAARLRTVVDLLPAMISVWDRDERNLMSNATAVAWFGISAEDSRGMTLRAAVGEEHYALFEPLLLEVRRGNAQVLRRTIAGADGVLRHIATSLTPRMVDGVFEGMTLLSSDVTEQTDALTSLDQAQQLAAIGSWTWSPDRPKEMVWSREMYRIAGQDPATFRPTMANFLARLHPDDYQRARELADTPVADDPESPNNEYEISYRLVLEDGEVRHVHARGRTVRGPEGRVVMIQGTAQDQTETRRAAQELATANTLLSDMMGMIGHDVRQPLSIVTNYLEQVTEDWTDLADDDRLKFVGTALDAGHRSQALIDDILMMVNLDSGSLVARPSTIRLGEFVPEAVLVAGLELVVDVRRDGLVAVDPFHLRQIVTNLVLNAVRYGRDPIEVVVDADDEHGYVIVTDAGDGVPEDFVPHLFERFTRASTGVASTTKGSGFGLYIVSRLLDANGGRGAYEAIRPVASQGAPQGARFTVTLPLLRR